MQYASRAASKGHDPHRSAVGKRVDVSHTEASLHHHNVPHPFLSPTGNLWWGFFRKHTRAQTQDDDPFSKFMREQNGSGSAASGGSEAKGNGAAAAAAEEAVSAPEPEEELVRDVIVGGDVSVIYVRCWFWRRMLTPWSYSVHKGTESFTCWTDHGQ